MCQLIPVIVRYVPLTAILTIVFGVSLYLYIGEANPAILFESRWGQTIFAAFLLALATFAIGMLFVVRTSGRMLTHLNEVACEHEDEAAGLQRTMNRSQLVVVLLSFVIIFLMVGASRGL